MLEVAFSLLAAPSSQATGGERLGTGTEHGVKYAVKYAAKNIVRLGRAGRPAAAAAAASKQNTEKHARDPSEGGQGLLTAFGPCLDGAPGLTGMDGWPSTGSRHSLHSTPCLFQAHDPEGGAGAVRGLITAGEAWLSCRRGGESQSLGRHWPLKSSTAASLQPSSGSDRTMAPNGSPQPVDCRVIILAHDSVGTHLSHSQITKNSIGGPIIHVCLAEHVRPLPHR